MSTRRIFLAGLCATALFSSLAIGETNPTTDRDQLWEELQADLASFNAMRAVVTMPNPEGGERQIRAAIYADSTGSMTVDPIVLRHLRYHRAEDGGFQRVVNGETSPTFLDLNTVSTAFAALRKGFDGQQSQWLDSHAPAPWGGEGKHWRRVTGDALPMDLFIAVNETGPTHLVVGVGPAAQRIRIHGVQWDFPLPEGALTAQRPPLDRDDPLATWWTLVDQPRPLCTH
jgi:hypothetical protein